jgi:hypothetical protein
MGVPVVMVIPVDMVISMDMVIPMDMLILVDMVITVATADKEATIARVVDLEAEMVNLTGLTVSILAVVTVVDHGTQVSQAV